MTTRKILCPSCGVGLKVSDSIPAGKRIKCPKCTEAFPVPGADEPEPVEIEAEEPARPRSAARPSKAARPHYDEGEDDEFEEEPEERPAPRKRKKKKKKAASSLPLILGLSIGGGVLLVGAAVALAVFRPWESKTGSTAVAQNKDKPASGSPGMERDTGREPDFSPRPEEKQGGGGGDVQLVSAGKKVYDSQDCSRCHSVGGGGGKKGGGRGPSLANVGSKRTADWITEHVRDPRSHRPTSRMPGYADKMSQEQLRSLGEYLASLR